MPEQTYNIGYGTNDFFYDKNNIELLKTLPFTPIPPATLSAPVLSLLAGKAVLLPSIFRKVSTVALPYIRVSDRNSAIVFRLTYTYVIPDTSSKTPEILSTPVFSCCIASLF